LKKRKSLPSISLSSNQSNLTAIANDFGFEHIFSRQIEALGRKGDLLIAISTSGNSMNIVNAIKSGISKDLNVIAFTGEDGGKINDIDCKKFKAPSKNVARLHLNHLDAELTILTDSQAEYIGVNRAGPYKKDEYRY